LQFGCEHWLIGGTGCLCQVPQSVILCGI